jgi:hypothetical protein
MVYFLVVFNNIVAFRKSSFIFNKIVAPMCSQLFLGGLVLGSVNTMTKNPPASLVRPGLAPAHSIVAT